MTTINYEEKFNELKQAILDSYSTNDELNAAQDDVVLYFEKLQVLDDIAEKIRTLVGLPPFEQTLTEFANELIEKC